jgi:hypothetical protein
LIIDDKMKEEQIDKVVDYVMSQDKEVVLSKVLVICGINFYLFDEKKDIPTLEKRGINVQKIGKATYLKKGGS